MNRASSNYGYNFGTYNFCIIVSNPTKRDNKIQKVKILPRNDVLNDEFYVKVVKCAVKEAFLKYLTL